MGKHGKCCKPSKCYDPCDPCLRGPPGPSGVLGIFTIDVTAGPTATGNITLGVPVPLPGATAGNVSTLGNIITFNAGTNWQIVVTFDTLTTSAITITPLTAALSVLATPVTLTLTHSVGALNMNATQTADNFALPLPVPATSLAPGHFLHWATGGGFQTMATAMITLALSNGAQAIAPAAPAGTVHTPTTAVQGTGRITLIRYT